MTDPLPEVRLDEGVTLDEFGADPPHCEDLLEHTDEGDACPCVPLPDEPALGDT